METMLNRVTANTERVNYRHMQSQASSVQMNVFAFCGGGGGSGVHEQNEITNNAMGSHVSCINISQNDVPFTR